jgi:hypothetical protein
VEQQGRDKTVDDEEQECGRPIGPVVHGNGDGEQIFVARGRMGIA